MLTDFVLYFFPGLKYLYWGAVFVVFISKLFLSQKLDTVLLIYLLLLLIGLSIVTISGRNAHGMLFVPFFAYMCFFIQHDNENKLNFDLFSLLIILILLFFSLVEIFLKLRILNAPWMLDFLSNVGSRRTDTLRARSLFASPLSLASIAIYLIFYTLYIHKNILYFYGCILLVIFSGSRTAMVICFFLLLFKFRIKTISIKRLIGLFFIICITGFILYSTNNFGLNFNGIFSLQSYNIRSDSSFRGRNNTTIKTALLILKDFPSILFLPTDTEYISDSAIIGIIAGSGMFLCFNFIGVLYNKINRIKIKAKRLLIFSIILLMLVVGDAFVPPATFYLFFMIYFYQDNKKLKRRICYGTDITCSNANVSRRY
ncbi:MAG: hypothetical protein LBE13_23175 [Bacteroidales bacterium]|jgi:hypothetical protein|nr:hypothetical protein [Bacteroidales bacterium]